MDLFSRVERALEGVVEGVFSRAFRTQLQPIEVAKRLENQGKMIVTVACSTGERYLSTPLAAEARAQAGA